MKKLLARAFALTALVCSVSATYATQAPTHFVDVTVLNTCAKPITFSINNNWGSMYTGTYNLNSVGTKDEQGSPANSKSFVFEASNDEEYYTVSYQTASCKVGYNLIRDKWDLTAVITGCDGGTPRCTLIQ